MVEEVEMVDSWLDELLKCRPDLVWSSLPRYIQAAMERSIADSHPGF